MEESWRQMSRGSMIPRRHSTEQDHPATRRQLRHDEQLYPYPYPSDDQTHHDFHDVFGGPPRTLLHRRFSGDFRSGASTFYDEIFRLPDRSGFQTRGSSGRNLPGFSIPNTSSSSSSRSRGMFVSTEEGFYDDIFGSDSGGGRRRWSISRSKSKSKSKSKSNSSSVLSCEDGYEPARMIAQEDDAMLSSFASKLRPITIPTHRHDSSSSAPSTVSGVEECSSNRTLTINPLSSFMDLSSSTNFLPKYQCRPPETVRSFMNRQQGTGSPSSGISSVFLEPLTTYSQGDRVMKKVVVQEEEELETADHSSFIIEIDSSSHGMVMGESEGAAAVDDAIAWAKEKFWNQNQLVVSDTILEARDSKDVEGGDLLMEPKENKLLPSKGNIWR